MPLGADDIDVLYRRHARTMLTFFARRTVDSEAAVDLVAETFAAAIEGREGCRARSDRQRAAWLFAIARNRLRTWYERGAIERKAIQRLGMQIPAPSEAEIERIDELAALAPLRSRVAGLIEELSDDVRAAVELRVVDERSYDEVAEALDINQDAARARVSRGLRSLAAQLEHEGGLRDG